MQDFLPDVTEPRVNEEEIVEVVEEKEPLSKKQILKLVAVGAVALLILLGIVVTLIETFGKREADDGLESLSERSKLIEKKPGRMSWLFYLDKDKDNVFDYEEDVFNGVSVSLRKPGETQILRTVPANVLGQVIMDDLFEGDYEVSFDNYAKDEVDKGEFTFPGMYQVVRSEDGFKEFLPNSWYKISLGLEGYYAKKGVVEYNPKSLLVFEGEDRVNFYDPKRLKIVGWSGDELYGSTLRADEIYFLIDDELKKVSLDDKIVRPVMNWLYEIGEYRLSPDGEVIVYRENDEFRYKSLGCGEGSVLIDGYRLELSDMLVDFMDDKLVVAGNLFEGTNRVYQVVCSEDDFVAREIVDSDVSSLIYLDEKSIFYSDASGSYFYDLVKDSKVRYTALGASVETINSVDKKYIGAIVDGKLMVVDYPAVMYSGVEKHYVIDEVSSLEGLSFSGSQVLVNRAKPCGQDGDCGEILRIGLKGSGVWKIDERVELKDVVVDRVLGEIEF